MHASINARRRARLRSVAAVEKPPGNDLFALVIAEPA
jgi:hypothetical protein